MKVFDHYATYYNLFYQNKDYVEEVRYLTDLLKIHAPDARSLLELGCGTGAHAQHLAARGYEVLGIDLSSQMLEGALERLTSLGPDVRSRLSFSKGDVRTFRSDKKFDAILSLFHVISYQITNEDLHAAFVSVKANLKPGGIFIFDCWYCPAVLTDRPEKRIKELENDLAYVTRRAEPMMRPQQNVVDVNYHITVKNKSDGQSNEFSETHPMRYLFIPEIEVICQSVGLKIVESQEWMTGRPPGFDTWGVCFVVR